jgi:hypothetical protein
MARLMSAMAPKAEILVASIASGNAGRARDPRGDLTGRNLPKSKDAIFTIF